MDRPRSAIRFLVLGSAAPVLIKGVSETLAGRVEFIELGGFDISEVGGRSLDTLWRRGGYPRSFLARSDADSVAWREGFIQTFLQRDIPQLGITLSAPVMESADAMGTEASVPWLLLLCSRLYGAKDVQTVQIAENLYVL